MNEQELRELFGRRHERPGDVFMDTLKRDGLIVAPGVYDAFGAKAARKIYLRRKEAGEPCSFNAVYLGHWSTSAMLFGDPDMGLEEFQLLALMGKVAIAKAYPLTVIFDIETGFGNSAKLGKVVETCHDMGAAVIHMEDQADGATVARRCGNHGGKWCLEPDEFVVKIRAVLSAKRALDSSTRLMVRTDALTAANGGLENAIERGKRYMDTNCQGFYPDILWADAMYDPKIIDRWLDEFRKFDSKIVLGLNYSPNRDWTPATYRKKFGVTAPTYEDLWRGGQGFNVIWHTILQARADKEATWNVFEDMAEYGAQALWRLHERQRNHPVGDAQAMTDVKVWQKYEEYLVGEGANERYDKSQGYKEGEKNN